jgi:hypothetical protein
VVVEDILLSTDVLPGLQILLVGRPHLGACIDVDEFLHEGGVLLEVAHRYEMLALKLFEMQLVEKIREQKPLLLLDDVFSELDGSRRRQLTEAITDTQVIITTTDADTVEKYYGHNNAFIALAGND